MKIKELDFIVSENPPLTVNGDLSYEEELKAIEEVEVNEDSM